MNININILWIWYTFIYAHAIQFNLLISNILLFNFKSDPTDWNYDPSLFVLSFHDINIIAKFTHFLENQLVFHKIWNLCWMNKMIIRFTCCFLTIRPWPLFYCYPFDSCSSLVIEATTPSSFFHAVLWSSVAFSFILSSNNFIITGTNHCKKNIVRW